MELFDIISNDIKEAMKAKDKVALDTLRNIKKVLLEAKTAPSRRHREQRNSHKGYSKTCKAGKGVGRAVPQPGRNDLADEELAQVAVMEKYLPKQMSEEEITAVLKEIIAQVGACKPQDMGKVMGVATKQLAGKADGKVISAIVKQLLA